MAVAILTMALAALYSGVDQTSSNFRVSVACRAVRTESLLNDLAAKQNGTPGRSEPGHRAIYSVASDLGETTSWVAHVGGWPDSGSQTAKFEPSGRCFSELTSSVA